MSSTDRVKYVRQLLLAMVKMADENRLRVDSRFDLVRLETATILPEFRCLTGFRTVKPATAEGTIQLRERTRVTRKAADEIVDLIVRGGGIVYHDEEADAWFVAMSPGHRLEAKYRMM